MRRRSVLLICLFAALLSGAAALRGSPLSDTPAAALFAEAVAMHEVNRIGLAERDAEPPPYTALTAASLAPDLLPYTESSMCASAILMLLQNSR